MISSEERDGNRRNRARQRERAQVFVSMSIDAVGRPRVDVPQDLLPELVVHLQLDEERARPAVEVVQRPCREPRPLEPEWKIRAMLPRPNAVPYQVVKSRPVSCHFDPARLLSSC